MKDKRRNNAISRVRSLVERPYAVIKRVFHAGYVMVTTIEKVHIKTYFHADLTLNTAGVEFLKGEWIAVVICF